MHAVPANDAHASDNCSQSAFADVAMRNLAAGLTVYYPATTFEHVHDNYTEHAEGTFQRRESVP